MEENILLPENPSSLGEAKLVSDPSSHLIEPSPNLADLRPVQISLNGLPETKANMFDKMDIDNHNVSVDNSTDSEIQKSNSTTLYSVPEDSDITASKSLPIETVSEQLVITKMDCVPNESISEHVESTDTNCLSSKPISEHSKIIDTRSTPSESVSEQNETITSNSVSDMSISQPAEVPESKSLTDEDLQSINDSPHLTPGKSRYGRIRRPKLSVDFVSVDRKSFAVLNSSSYDFVHAEESRSPKSPVVKKKRSYIRKSSVLSKSDSQPTTPNDTLQKSEQLGESSKPETGESKTEFTITNSDVCPLDESSISSLNSSIIKTYSRLSEAGVSSDDRQSGTEDNASKEPILVNYTELNWKVGDVAWAKVGCYPYWPSIVTLEYGSSIYAKHVGKRGNRLAVHVQFFGDRGRRSWVLTTSLIKYESKEQFLELRRQYSKDKIRNKYFNIIRTKDLWEKAILEADTILKLPNEERIQYYKSIYPVSEEAYVAEMTTNKVKTPIRRKRKNPEERRGRKRKILGDLDNHEIVKKKKKLENLGSKSSASQRGSVLMRRGRGRPPKKLTSSMEEHLRKRRAFEKRLKKLMTQSGDEKAKTKPGKNTKSQNSVNKFDQLMVNGKAGESASAKKDEPKKKDALSVYDFESDEETDVFLGTYNSRYTPHLLAKIEEKKADEGENAEAPNSSAEASSIPAKLSDENNSDEKPEKENDCDENPEKENVDVVVEPIVMKEESSTDTNAEVKPKRGRGRPKGSKNVKTLMRLQQMKGRPFLGKNKAQEKLALRRRRKALILKAEQKTLKKQSSETNDGSDSISEQKKKVHPKKRLLEKSRRSEKITKTISAENIEESDKMLPDENAKINKRSPSMSPKDDLDSDDDDLKVIRPDGEEGKRRSSSPQPASYKSKKSSALFSGFKFEKVCLICEKLGDTIRCRGPCSGTYHIECAASFGNVEMKKVEVVENVAPCKPRRGRPPRASSVNLVNVNESGEVKDPVENEAGSDESQSDPVVDQSTVDNVNNENCSSASSAEDNVTKTDEPTTSEADDLGLSTNDGTSSANELESGEAENAHEDDTSLTNCEEETSTKTIAASVPNLETQKLNDRVHPTDETLSAAELDNSVIENSETSLMNGHCDLSGADDASMNDQVTNPINEATENHSTEEKIEKSDAKEITMEKENISIMVKQQNEEAEELSIIKEVPDTSRASLNDHPNEEDEVCSLDKNDQTVDDSVTSSEANEQVEKQRVPHSVDADHSVEDVPVSSSTSDNEAVDDSTGQNRVEETKETITTNINDENVEEPSSSTANANKTTEELKNADHRVEEESVSCVAGVSTDEEPDSCSDSMNLQLVDDVESCDAEARNPVEKENVCDMIKDEDSLVPVSLLENEEAGSSDAGSENLSCSTKTDGSNGIDFRCAKCCENKLYPCFTCGQDVEEKTGEAERHSCHLSSCGRVYHKECLKAWPQATWKGNISGRLIRNGSSVSRNAVLSKETLMCPQHYCHTCISENPAVHKNRHCNEILVRCIRCPTAYHRRVHCIPAGTEILTMSQIICPRHYEPPVGAKNTVHFNTSWCFICCIGGSLICCDECPTSFHADCLQLRPEEYEGRYICDDCQSGRYLLYGDIAWVKLGHYRWWPARILYPNEVPENIQQLPHRRGEFVVQFYGSHNYNWVNRGRAFLYQEGDSGKKSCGRSAVDLSFVKAIQEAEEAYGKLKIVKAARDEEARLGWKPPKYAHIKANKPVGNVRIVELNTSNITPCECDPQSERPCGPDSDCINRMLLVECNPNVCPAGDRCYNQMFEKRIYPPLMPYNTDKRGWGLKTLVDMKKGDFIIEYVGEMIDEEEYKRRVNIMHKNQEDNYYFLTIDKDRMLDAGPKGNVARFMNHSCDPNCETQKWTVNGDTRVGLFALKDIPANTELVFNYNLATQGNEMKPCFCGSEKCSGYIGVKAVKNGGLNVEDELRKRSEESEGEQPGKKKMKRGRGRPRKKIRKRILTPKQPEQTDDKPPTDVPQRVENPKVKKLRQKIVAKKMASRFNKWSVSNPRFKTKTRIAGVAKNNVESLLKHRELLKQRTMAQGSAKVTSPKEKKKAESPQPSTSAPDVSVTPHKEEKKTEHRGRPKTPKTEEEKQALLFEMMRKRIQRKIEEMTLCKLDEKCFVCGDSQEDDELLFCDNNKCPKGYHLQCVNLAKWPSGRWLCPWHYCSICRSIRKVLKCDTCTNSYCFLHVSENLFKENNGRYFCKEHKTSNSELIPTPKFVKEIVIEMADALNTTAESSTSDTPPAAKRPRGRPKGSKAIRYHMVEIDDSSRDAAAADASPDVAAKRTKRPSAKMAEANGAASPSPPKRKILTKRRSVREEQPSPGDEPARKKFKRRAAKQLPPNGDAAAAGEEARPAGKLVVEANVKFEMMNNGGGGGASSSAASGDPKPDVRLSDGEEEQRIEAPETKSSPAKASAHDSDESFGSFVATEVMVVDEVPDQDTSKEASELSEAAGTASDDNTQAADVETSDDEYVNLEVEVVNGDESN